MAGPAAGRRTAAVPIRSRADLIVAGRDPRINGIIRRTRVTLDLAELTQRQRREWEARLDRYQRRCGCLAGSLVTLASLAVALPYVAGRAASPAGLVGLGLAGALGSLALGFAAKVVSQLVTRAQFARACQRLAAVLPDGARPGGTNGVVESRTTAMRKVNDVPVHEVGRQGRHPVQAVVLRVDPDL